MNRILIVILIVLFSVNAWSSESYVVDLQKLDSAINSFVNDPSSQAADNVEKLLPAGKERVHSEPFNYDAYTRVFEKNWPLEKLIKRGNSHAVRVVYALTAISDGEYSYSLSVMLGASAENHPHEFLIGVKQRRGWQDPPCDDVAMMEYGFNEGHVEILKARLNAIKSVSDPSLEKEKACSIKVIEKAMKEPPMW